MKKVLTIIVTYNGIQWIEDCLNSLKESIYPTDVIIIDNGSTDETISFIEQNFPKAILEKSVQNLGFGKANNIGLRHGLHYDYNYFFLLNQDAWIFPDTIGNLINNHNSFQSYGIISPIQLNKSLEVEYIFRSYLKKLPQLLNSFDPSAKYENRIFETDFVNAAMWMLSKECVLNTGGFSPLFYHYGEDVDYVNRAKYHGFKIGVSQNAFGIHDRKIKELKTTREYNRRKTTPRPMAFEVLYDSQ